MTTYFDVPKIQYEGPGSKNPFAFRHYNAGEIIDGKTMAEHLRFAVCYWHTFRGAGADPFGGPVYIRSWDDAETPLARAEKALDAAFEFFEKLGVQFWCFHDRDIAPQGATLAETNENLDHMIDIALRKQRESGMKLLWGTANLFSNRRYIAGAGTNPDPRIFAYAAAQVKKALEASHKLGGEGYVFWGGREGYETLLNTDMGQETDHLALLLRMAVEHKKKIGFQGAFYIEPKPREPTKHQYDFDAQSCHAFLMKHGLEKDFLLNIEANHATLAGHEFVHELEYAAANGLLGSVDANRGDTLVGWDTDQFPTDRKETTLAMRTILRAGGFQSGGLNFDAKLRRQSIDAEDLFHAHIGAMDAFAFGLKAAVALREDGRLDQLLAERYQGWSGDLGRKIANGATLEEMEAFVLANPEPQPSSGRQELLENIVNDAIQAVIR